MALWQMGSPKQKGKYMHDFTWDDLTTRLFNTVKIEPYQVLSIISHSIIHYIQYNDSISWDSCAPYSTQGVHVGIHTPISE